jgi:hypothetical protein
LQVVNSASTTVLAAYGNGNLTYSGSLFQSSDERIKTNITSLDATTSLALISNLNPVSYTRSDQPQDGTTLGFIAQEVQRLFPELVIRSGATALTPDGTLILNYTGLIAPITKALQALSAQINALATTISALADNISTQNLSFSRAKGDTITTTVLCIEDVCVTRTELAAMLAATKQMPSTQNISSGTTQGESHGPPIISIQGDNPAHISIGSQYQDLGAVITGPRDSDRNLGIQLFLDGIAVDSISLDTRTERNLLTEYVASNEHGVSTSSRTVLITDSEYTTTDVGPSDSTMQPESGVEPDPDAAVVVSGELVQEER